LSVQITDIAKGVQGYYIKNERFNTTLLTYNFYLPLSSENMAVDSLLPYILTSCSQQYPDYIDLNLRLLELYGADLSCSATKCGDCFHIKIGISVIDQRFSIDGSNPVAAAAELINGLIFNPSLTDGFFLDRDIQREKRKPLNA
jgi:hypothetical protein